MPGANNYLSDEIRGIFFHEIGTYWVYQNDSGEVDTVSLQGSAIDTLNYVDKNGNHLCYKVDFSNTYFSTHLKSRFLIYTRTVSPYNEYAFISINWSAGGERLMYKSPYELNVKYNGSAYEDEFIFEDTYTQIIDGIKRTCHRVSYKTWPSLSYDAATIVYAEGIGIVSILNQDTGEYWDLIYHSN